MRTKGKTHYTYIENGGWHFSYQVGKEQIRMKIESGAHQEFNKDDIKSKIEDNIVQNKDTFGRKFKFWIDESALPNYLLENKASYQKFFK